MSLIPFMWDNQCRLLGQHFGQGIDVDDLLTSIAFAPVSRSYYRPWHCVARGRSRLDAGSKISVDKDKYQVCLDVQQFSPEEITVKTVGRQVVIEGKHEEKEDEHGYISRKFVRKYQLPEEYKPEDVVSSLSTDGVLTIMAPRNQPPSLEAERVVPITSTSSSHKNIENKSDPKSSSEGKMDE